MGNILFLVLTLFLSACRIPLTDKLIQGESSDSSAEAGSRTTIGAIQGSGHISPYNDQRVEGVMGVVTLIEDEGFWIQSPTETTGDPSQGLFVYERDLNEIRLGDLVKVGGLVKEHGESSELTLTELTGGELEIIASSSPLPPPAKPGSAGWEIPVNIICNDGPGGVSQSHYDPEEDLIDYWESMEGMVVEFDSLIAAGGSKSGQIPLLAAGIPWQAGVNLPTLMMETAGQSPLFDSACGGDTIPGPVRAVMTYKWGEFTLLPLGEWNLVKTLNPEINTLIPFDESRLTVASFNMENYSLQSSGLTDQETARKQADLIEIISHNLGAPDIIAVQEIMDDSGATDNGITEGWKNFTTLTTALNDETGKSYYFASADPGDKTDGGLPGANIRVGFLYDMDRIKLLAIPQRLCLDDFADCRKPLLARFSFRGQETVLINVHLSSRRSDTPFMGEYQPPLLHSEPGRLNQAMSLRREIEGLLPGNVIILGDFNDYCDSPVLRSLMGTEGSPFSFLDATDSLPSEEKYTYVYRGRPNQLDHILISPNLVERGFTGEILHLNSRMAAHDRAADHDPVLVSLNYPMELSQPEQEGGLFFCDYGEGSGYNKYLELLNLAGSDTSPGEYGLIYCANGAPIQEGKVYPLPAIPRNSLAGICHSRSEEVILTMGSIQDSPSFNGNDQLILIRDNNSNGAYEQEIDRIVDMIGYPLSEEDYAKDRGMRRQPFVNSGSQTFVPAEWIPYSKEQVDSGEFYGNHRTNRGELFF
jgi:predicted extracellular nuclease